MYTRAMASDYNDWATVHGNAGWSHKDLLPLLRKTETYQVGDGKPAHGYSGPLKVSHGGAYTNVGREFLEVAAAYDKERGSTDDINSTFGPTSINKYGVSTVFLLTESQTLRSAFTAMGKVNFKINMRREANFFWVKVDRRGKRKALRCAPSLHL
jgi:alcohol oxidase